MQILAWTLAFIAGAALGSFFFGSLWITVRQLPTTGWPIRLVIGSYIGRMAIALLGFYLLVQADWTQAIAGLTGFITLRVILIRWLRPLPQTLSSHMGSPQ
jgi:F1F0 ATPase subunit 2